MTGTASISKLAFTIAENTAVYENYFKENGLPTPSHDVGIPLVVNLPEHVENARLAILEASTELQALVHGPTGHIHNQTYAHTNLIGLHAIYRFKLATSLAIDEEVSYQELARRSGLVIPYLRRIMRYVMTKHIFKETRDGLIAHTVYSQALAQVPNLSSWLGFVCEEMWPASTRVVDAIAKWPESQEPRNTGFAIAHGVDASFFEFLAQNPDSTSRFTGAMSLLEGDPSISGSHTVKACSWDYVRVFVDIGGGNSATCLALADQYPDMKCIIQDREDITEQVNSFIPSALKERVEFMGHDFFKEQPVRGADVYHLRFILHDWSDKYCLKILRSLVPALKPGARVIISDHVVPYPGTVSIYNEWETRAFDLAMLELFNSKERDATEWKELFKEADSRFSLQAIRHPPGAKLSCIEVVWDSATNSSSEEWATDNGSQHNKANI